MPLKQKFANSSEFVDAMTWKASSDAPMQSEYQAACAWSGFKPGPVPSKATIDDSSKSSPCLNQKTANSPEFSEAMKWKADSDSPLQSEYQAGYTASGFVPKEIPGLREEEQEQEQGQGDSAVLVRTKNETEEPSVASTETPLYYAWDLIPPAPAGAASGQAKKRKGRKSKKTKLALKARPKEVAFESAAEALNPAQSASEGESQKDFAPQPTSLKSTDPTPSDASSVLPIEAFGLSSPSNFFVSAEQAWKVKSKSEAQDSYRWTDGHVETSIKSVTGKQKGKDVMKENDVTSQRVFTFRGAKKVLQRCKEEQVARAREPAKKQYTDSAKKLQKGLIRRRSVSELQDANILRFDDAQDEVARKRNTSIELTRMLESRPRFLPDGRARERTKSAEKIEKTLANRPTVDELVEKNVIKSESNENNKAATRRKVRLRTAARILFKFGCHKISDASQR